jgi:hypothetical protein
MFGTRTVIPAVVLIILAFSGCFAPWGDDSATVTLNMGGRNGRAVDPETLNYTIVLTGPTGTITRQHSGSGTVTIPVVPGNWNIAISAYMEPESGKTLLFSNGDGPYAQGSQDANIKAGPNTVQISMAVLNPPDTDNATNPITTLGGALKALEEKTGAFAIGIGSGSDETLGSTEIKANQNITLRNYGKEMATVRLNTSPNNPGALFTLRANSTLTLEGNITLVGKPSTNNTLSPGGNNSALVVVSSSRAVLYIKDNVIISGNDNITLAATPGSGGGVYVANEGTVIMTGGIIRDNASGRSFLGVFGGPTSGGGVNVGEKGFFTMSGGSIINNSAYTSGGGVYVAKNGTFTMTGGIISNNTANIIPNDVDVNILGTFKRTGGTVGRETTNDDD